MNAAAEFVRFGRRVMTFVSSYQLHLTNQNKGRHRLALQSAAGRAGVCARLGSVRIEH